MSEGMHFLLFQELPEKTPSTENKTQVSQAEPLPLPLDIKTTLSPPPYKVQIICTAVSVAEVWDSWIRFESQI